MNSTIVDALGWAIINSLWECAAIAVLFAVGNIALRRSSANARYLLGYSSLLAMPVALIATFLSLFGDHPAVSPVAPSPYVPDSQPIISALSSTPVVASSSLPYIQIVVWFWIAGVVAMSTWSMGGWIAAQRLKWRSKQPLPEFWQSQLAVLAERLGIRRTIRLCESTLAEVPAVIGWLRPVILVPAGALVNLSTRELEAVLAHELAHIRRFDYAANLLQSAVETLMFYHPAMWWISRRVRAERENCCDDVAIMACGDRLVYARALTNLEKLRSGTPEFAMAATGGPLLARIRRLLGQDDTRRRRALPVWVALAAVLVAMLVVTSGIRLRAQDGSVPSPQSPDPPAPASMPAPAQPAARPLAPPAPKPATASAAQLREFVPPAPAPPATPPAAEPPAPQPPDIAPAPAVDVLTILQQQIQALEQYKATLLETYTPKHEKVRKVEAQLAALLRSYADEGKREAPAPHREGYLAGLVDAGYTQISVDEIIALRDNGVDSKYIKGMMQAGFGTPTPKDLINLHNNGVSPEYARKAVAAAIPKLTIEHLIDLARNGVNLDAVQRIHALGFGPFSNDELIDLQRNGVSADLFDALKESGYTKIDAHQAVAAAQSGLSAHSLHSLREQGFKGLTIEQVIKLARAGVI